MNRLTDHIASHPHHTPLLPSPLPFPSHGLVESNPNQFIDSLLSHYFSFSLDTYHAPMIPSPLFGRTPPLRP